MAKRPTKKPTRKPDDSYVAASVQYNDTVKRTIPSRTTDFDVVARAIGLTAWSAANLNATSCASNVLRLYKPPGGRTIAKSRPIRSRGRMAWLLGDGQRNPGIKAVQAASASDEIEEVVDHPVLDLMYRPDPHTTGAQWRWLSYFFTEVAGRVFFYAGERTKYGPTSLYTMAPQYTTINASKTNFIDSYVYGVDGTSGSVYKAEDVIYHRERINPMQPLHAISWMHSIQTLTDLEAAAVQSEIARWNNGGVPGMVIMFKDPTGKVTSDKVEQARGEFNRTYRGVDKSGATMFLLNAEVAQYGPKPHEMQYVEGVRRMEEAIYRAAGIPEPVWKMASSNRASADSADPQWQGSTILPKINSFAETLTEYLLPMYDGTDGWWFAYDNPVREDQDFALSKTQSLASAGIITGNEARRMLLMDDGGELLDTYRFNGVPVMPASIEVASGGTAPADGGEELSFRPVDNTEEKTKEPPPAVPVVKSIRVKNQSNALEAAARSFESSLHAWFVHSLKVIVSEDGTVDMSVVEADLSRVVESGLRQLFVSGTVDALSDVGQPGSIFNLERDDATKYLRERGGELIVSIESTLKETVSNKVALMSKEGVGISDIIASVQKMGIADWSAERIVRTEMAFAYTEGARQAWLGAGVRNMDFILGGEPCPLCTTIYEMFGNKPQPIDKPYFASGTSLLSIDGKTHTFKRDVYGPPWHPNCVCDLVPVMNGSKQ